MKKYKLKNDLLANPNQKLWLGIDVHKVNLHVTVLDDEGETVLSQSVPHKKEHVVGLIRRLNSTQITAVYEAGPTGYKLVYWLKELGCEAFMCPPTHVRQRRGGRIKTDARDSKTLAEQARANMLPAVHLLDEEVYRQRQITRTREQLARHRSQLKTQIKSLLLFHKITCPEDLKPNWSKAYIKWLEQEAANDPDLSLAINALLRAHASMDEEIKVLDARLREIEASKRWAKNAELLRSIPGVGGLTAMVVLLESGDLSRFDNGEELASWIGLVPTEWSSGEGQHRGSITRAGNKRVRTALVEASWMVVRNDAAMKAVYERIKKRRGAGKAIVAVARRLALIIRAMLRDQQPFEYQAAAT